MIPYKMMKFLWAVTAIIVGVTAGSETSATEPVIDLRFHTAGEVEPIITTYNGIGYFGFPRGSRIGYLHGTKLLFGAVRGLDTLVTDFSQFPIVGENSWETNAYEPIRRLSAHRSDPDFSPDAIADEEYHLVMWDTAAVPAGAFPSMFYDWIERRPHRPIGLEIRQSSSAWQGEFMKRVVIVDVVIRNVSELPIADGVIGLFAESRVRLIPPGVSLRIWPPLGVEDGVQGQDDICGLIRFAPLGQTGILDTPSMMWFADNDGNPFGDKEFTTESPVGVMGIRVLRHPVGGRMSFNWWVIEYNDAGGAALNWGPRQRNDRMGYRSSYGAPFGDRAKYRMMANGEIDYDQVFAGVARPFQEGWEEPAPGLGGPSISRGNYPSAILSFGPLESIHSGDSVSLTFALVGGAEFHRYPDNFLQNFSTVDPQPYLNNVDFSDLIKNARWADWWFDNPGVDTDGDGYRGRAYLVNCDAQGNCDSIFYKGDGVPDWRGPSAPLPPPFEMSTFPGEVLLRWNGRYSETAIDAFSLRRDFEGYRLYLGKFDRDDQYSMIASWDIEDYKRMEYVSEGTATSGLTRRWKAISYPYAPEEWPVILGDTDFDVRDYLVQDPALAYRDTVTDTTRNVAGEIVKIETRERLSTWTAEAYNRGNEYEEAGYPEINTIQRVGERDTVINGEPFTYGIYEARLTNLNPAVPLYVSITAFDYGDYLREFDPLESSQSNNSEYAHFIYTPDIVKDSGLGVSVYPNPYKVIYDGPSGERTTYYREGYEGRGDYNFQEQDRRIWFVNLPEMATIRIFSLDGDLIRTINHPDPFLTKYPSAVGWDLVSRNIQAVTSGIYIWRVDSELGTQMGKLVIIK